MTSKDDVRQAMSLQQTERVPVMCQLANGHTIINTGVHPIDYWIDSELWADCLLKIRSNYDFDGVLCHKPGRVPDVMDFVERTDYDAETPTLYMNDGARIECTRDDDAYYKGNDDFAFPDINDLDPDDLLGWAPESYRIFQASKATFPISDADGFDERYFATLDRVIELAGDEYSIHGEVRAPLDHFLNLVGMENGLMAIMDVPDKVHAILDATTGWSVALAVAQARRGAAAIKISSPFAGSSFLSRDMYVEFVLPYEQRLAAAVTETDTPIYTHTCGAIGDRLDLLCDAGVTGIECLDPPPLGDVDIAEAVQRLQGKIFIKGNVDPVNTLLRGDRDQIRTDVTGVLNAAQAMSGFILSSACSVAPPTPPDNLKTMVEVCREFTA